MSFGMMGLIFLAFMFVILGFAAVLGYFLKIALPTVSSVEIDTAEEALNRKI